MAIDSSELKYLRELVLRGGPEEKDYDTLDQCIQRLYEAQVRGDLLKDDLEAVRDALGDSLDKRCIQGFAFCKPRGYAGDFEVIDRMYTHFVSEDPSLVNWDHYYHRMAAAKAVRNRKTYFKALMDRLYAVNGSLRVLDIASGSGRGIAEWMDTNPRADVSVDCVELDRHAIDYAAHLNSKHLQRVAFIHKNALRYRPSKSYDLIWAAGIFDYFSDKLFAAAIRRYLPAVASGGKLVIGNFCNRNSTLAYMVIVTNWILNHRNREDLHRLAIAGGAETEQISIDSEPEEVNLFLHVRG